METETFTLDEAPEACRRLHQGNIRGRAVVVPRVGPSTRARALHLWISDRTVGGSS